jgi:GT2 family glycosyltransferase
VSSARTFVTTGLRIRVVVVDHDGGDMTLDCLDRIIDSGTPAGTELEVVLVDNGSTRSVASLVAERWPEVDVRRSPTNKGFAGGNNLALRDLDRIDFVALVNNDVMVSDGWLEPLLAALVDDDSIGAAGPKLVFADRYRELELTADGTVAGRGDHRVVGVRWFGVAGDDGETRSGQLVEGFLGRQRTNTAEWFEWTAPKAVARFALHDVDGDRCWLRLGAGRPTTVTVRSGEYHEELVVDRGVGWYGVDLGGEPFDVINNTGTVMLEDGYGADRGFLERDRGQYDRAEDVTAWCGGAVLLRTEYLRDVGLFDERLFLYYEDLELSLRGAKRGWRHRYEPQSVVRHRVGATSVHGSPTTERYKERNRLLVLVRHFPPRTATAASLRFLLSTASYTRRDVLAPLLQGRRPDAAIVVNRLRAFGEFLRLVPAMWRSRRLGSRQA